MDLRSGHLSITGAMGPSTSWDPWPRPVARAAVGTQECTQIGEDGLSAQPPLACRMRLLVRPTRRMRFSVTSPVQNAPFGHVEVASPVQSVLFRESDTPRVRLCVSRRLQSGALVYAAATRFAEASTHTNPRRARFVYTFAPPWKPRPMGSRQARARSSYERALSFWRRTSQPQPPRNPPIGRAPPSCPPPVPMVLPSPGLLILIAGPAPLGAHL